MRTSLVTGTTSLRLEYFDFLISSTFKYIMSPQASIKCGQLLQYPITALDMTSHTKALKNS